MSKLLVVINMQKGFDCSEARAVIPNLNKFYTYFDNVSFVMFENRKNSLFETQLKWIDFQNEEDRKLIEGVEIPQNAHFTHHHNYTVYNDELKALIKKLKPAKVYLSGLFSDVCLLKTAMDMFDDGIVPYIIKDISGSPHGDIAHEVAFAAMKEGLGADRIISTKEIS
ncbi:isochorismatase family protein [Francisella tularensis]|uniref:isochorismatase family protein n=1 Tax=Francisella tularensis TaxID=263 RepID=UPI000173E409|nr:isochorismatase family protein [Francisella tularensis]ACD31068.1 isochorismatase family protein [Francisella tularensis subsp. mediasiatica FSC147]AJI68218.1 isochorismatase family protein [Francisella tularensis subsp. holarctica]AKO68766.1 isochorismatase [Francisella tularensis subsp. holarctica]AZP07959.1 isochorismatase family protein [Francisella tularensis]KXO27748.1 isochorismatase [Francisella tularensis]